MFEFVRNLFDTSDFPARWTCGNWEDAHGWLHIGSDVAIFAAYFALPLSITFFVSRRPDVTYPRLYWLFAAFIFSCGLGHLVEATLFWHPWYRFSGLIKLVTAGVSWMTVVALIQVLPTALQLPGIAKLNVQLKQEVEERKQAEAKVLELNEKLKERVEELQTLLKVIPVGIGIASDAECRDIQTNPALASMLEVAPGQNASLSARSEARPTHFQVFDNGVEVPADRLPMQEAARTGEEILGKEVEVIFQQNRAKHLLVYAAPLFDGEQKIRGAVGAFVEITDRKSEEAARLAFEQKLQETQKLESLGVLAGGIAHDFNNLLTAIIGNSSLARMELAPSSLLIGHLTNIEAAAYRAADLCKQMLAYAGKGQFVLKPINISKLVEETAFLLQTSIGKGAILRMDLYPNLPPVLADPTQIQQIVMNLVINASDAIGGRSGYISISTGVVHANREYLDGLALPAELAEGDYVFFETSDTGGGMSPETMAKIFDPFFTTKFTGRGLGLAAVLGIVRSHKGGIKVYSELGRGTTFKVLLPCWSEAAVEETPTVVESSWSGSGQVLVIDDEETIRAITGRMLSVLGFTPIFAQNGREGVEVFKSKSSEIQLVLLDLTMPDINGEEAFRQLRMIDSNVKVVLMSGFSEHDALNRFVGKRLAGFMQKPFGVSLLREILKKALEPPR